MDAVFYLLDALRLFRGKSLQEIREITFEIGMLPPRRSDCSSSWRTSKKECRLGSWMLSWRMTWWEEPFPVTEVNGVLKFYPRRAQASKSTDFDLFFKSISVENMGVGV